MKNLIVLFFTVVFLVGCKSEFASIPTGNSTLSAEEPTPPVITNCSQETFSSAPMSVGSVNGQDSWRVDTSSGLDESVMKIGSEACRGQSVWKINNSKAVNGFTNMPASPALSQTSGESTVRSNGGGDTIETSLYFRTASTAADGTVVSMSLSPTAGDDRFTLLKIENNSDDKGGLQISAFDGALLKNKTMIKASLQRARWHHLRIAAQHVNGQNSDGSSNDIVQVYVNGELSGTHTTWEAFFASIPQPVYAVNRVMFRVSIPASELGFANPQGLYIDDFTQKVYNSTTPSAVLSHYETGFETP